MKTTAAKPMSQIERYILLTFGVLLTAVGVYFFKFPNNFSTGGVSGLSLILGRVFPSPVLTPSAFVFIINMALLALEVDYLGLDNVDRRMLQAIIENYGGGPVGLDTLAATIGEESVTLEDVYEPYLMQLGFLPRTPRGRCVTQKAYEHLHMEFAGQTQLTL